VLSQAIRYIPEATRFFFFAARVGRGGFFFVLTSQFRVFYKYPNCRFSSPVNLKP
jgi:hypothetical protein